MASARCVWLSVRMSVAVSISINQSSNFKESCPSNVGISFSMVMVRFASLCVAHKVSVYTSIALCTGSSLGWGDGCGWSIIARCCRLSVSCISSAVGVGGWVADFKLVKWSLSYQNCSSNSAKGQ